MPRVCLGLEFTGKDLLEQGFPDVIFDPKHVTSGPAIASRSSTKERWIGDVVQWPEFVATMQHPRVPPNDDTGLCQVRFPTYNPADQETWSKIQEQASKSMPMANNYKAPKISVNTEHFITGEEKGAEERFGHYALNVLGAVPDDRHLPLLFANFRGAMQTPEKSSSAKAKAKKVQAERGTNDSNDAEITIFGKDLPDFAGIMVESFAGSYPQLRTCGEVKGSWDDDLENAFETETWDSNDALRRVWLYQITGYMTEFHLRYAFLTVQRYTVFLKMDIDELGIGYLSASPAIEATAFSSNRTVSVRECLWWMMTEVGTATVGNKERWRNKTYNPVETAKHFRRMAPKRDETRITRTNSNLPQRDPKPLPSEVRAGNIPYQPESEITEGLSELSLQTPERREQSLLRAPPSSLAKPTGISSQAGSGVAGSSGQKPPSLRDRTRNALQRLYSYPRGDVVIKGSLWRIHWTIDSHEQKELINRERLQSFADVPDLGYETKEGVQLWLRFEDSKVREKFRSRFHK